MCMEIAKYHKNDKIHKTANTRQYTLPQDGIYIERDI